MNNKIIIVAGGTGNIGSRIIKELLNKEVEVQVKIPNLSCKSTKCEHSFFFN